MTNAPEGTINHSITHNVFAKHKKIIFAALSLFFLLLFLFFSFIVKKHFLSQSDFNMSVYVQDDTPMKLDKLYQFFSTFASVQGMSILLLVILLFRKNIIRGILVL